MDLLSDTSDRPRKIKRNNNSSCSEAKKKNRATESRADKDSKQLTVVQAVTTVGGASKKIMIELTGTPWTYLPKSEESDTSDNGYDDNQKEEEEKEEEEEDEEIVVEPPAKKKNEKEIITAAERSR